MRHETDSLRSADGLQLHLNRWLPEGPVRAHLLIVHGYAEHSARYAHLAAFLNLHGFAVHAYDQRGHGKSGGKMAYVDRFELYLKDLTAVLDRVRQQAKKTPLFLLGHSMGGAVVTRYVITREPDYLSGVLLSAAMLKISDDISPLLQKVSGILGEWLPKVPTIKLNSADLSRDSSVVAAYDADPLVYHGGAYARTGAEFVAITRQIQSDFARFTLPVLIMHGTADRVTDPQGSALMASHAASSDKTLRKFEGLYHELVNEPEKDQVMQEMLSWMEARLYEPGPVNPQE